MLLIDFLAITIPESLCVGNGLYKKISLNIRVEVSYTLRCFNNGVGT